MVQLLGPDFMMKALVWGNTQQINGYVLGCAVSAIIIFHAVDEKCYICNLRKDYCLPLKRSAFLIFRCLNACCDYSWQKKRRDQSHPNSLKHPLDKCVKTLTSLNKSWIVKTRNRDVPGVPKNARRLTWCKLKTTVSKRSAFWFSESSHFNLKLV